MTTEELREQIAKLKDENVTRFFEYLKEKQDTYPHSLDRHREEPNK